MANGLFKFGTQQTEPTRSKSGDFGLSENQITISESTFNTFRDFIYTKSGIFFNESKKYLFESRLEKRIKAIGVKSFEEYFTFVQKSGNVEELHQLYDAITINETYFFRAPQQFEAVEKIIIPELVKNKAGKSNFIRFWSAASSTGEESYTLAMLVNEFLKPKYPHITFQILASDINTAVIESAKKGIFKEYAVRNIPPNLLNKYFKTNGMSYELSPDIRKMVRFANINLYDERAVKTITGVDVIFCANVLIYFDIPSKQKVVQHLYDVLNPEGYLFIGYSESLHGISKAFSLIHLPKALAYKK
jgi:chemotaxis protein methyltransferase CheR